MATHNDENDNNLRLETVGRFLREKRVAAGLTQWDVARELNYTTAQFVSNWERGVSIPPFNALPTLTELLRIPAQELIDVMMDYQEQLLQKYAERLSESLGLDARGSRRKRRAGRA